MVTIMHVRKKVPVLFFLTEHHAMKAYSLTSALPESECKLHAPAASPPGKRAPFTHWIGDWVGPRAGLNAVVKEA